MSTCEMGETQRAAGLQVRVTLEAVLGVVVIADPVAHVNWVPFAKLVDNAAAATFRSSF